LWRVAKKLFPQRGMLKFTNKGRFLTIKIAYEKFLDWQFLALNNFGQFWADFPAFTVAKSMPELGLKSSKSHNFSTVSPNVTCNDSLESYHPYL
jgi:hypothetical protein